jgi:type II secretory pathway predicted ATPase ExeA
MTMAKGKSRGAKGAKNRTRRLSGPLVENRITRFLSLQTDPFHAQHDPRFIVDSGPMREALLSLRDLLEEPCQLILITGEAGIGKTVLLDAIARDSHRQGPMARIDDPTVGWAEIGQEIGAQLGLEGGRLSPGAMVTESGQGRVLSVFIDSAQCLPENSLKHLQAYLDLEAPAGMDSHLLQLVLFARNTAPSPVFGWLREREHQCIGFQRLDSSESRRYILRRMRVAAGVDRLIFSEEALRRVAKVTGGLPGAINQTCQVALDMAVTRGEDSVDAELIGEVSERLKQARRRHRKSVITTGPSSPVYPVPDEVAAEEESWAAAAPRALGASPSAEESAASPSDEESTTSLSEEESAASPSDEEPAASLSDEEPTASLSDEESAAPASDEEPAESLSEEESVASPSDEEPATSLSDEKSTDSPSDRESAESRSDEESVASSPDDEPTASPSDEEFAASLSDDEAAAWRSDDEAAAWL